MDGNTWRGKFSPPKPALTNCEPRRRSTKRGTGSGAVCLATPCHARARSLQQRRPWRRRESGSALPGCLLEAALRRSPARHRALGGARAGPPRQRRCRKTSREHSAQGERASQANRGRASAGIRNQARRPRATRALERALGPGASPLTPVPLSHTRTSVSTTGSALAAAAAMPEGSPGHALSGSNGDRRSNICARRAFTGAGRGGLRRSARPARPGSMPQAGAARWFRSFWHAAAPARLPHRTRPANRNSASAAILGSVSVPWQRRPSRTSPRCEAGVSPPPARTARG